MSPVDPRVVAAAVSASVGAQMGAAAGAAAGALIGQISVEIDGLAKAATVMRDELKEGYRTQVPQVHDAMQPGATIGDGIQGSEWDDLRDRYDECINATLGALFNLDLGTQAMANAASEIAKNYRNADELSRATVSDVQDAITQTPQHFSIPNQSVQTGGTGNA